MNTPIVIIDDGSLINTTQDVEKKSDKKSIAKLLKGFETQVSNFLTPNTS